MRLSPSTAISLLALVISLGGAGYAATGSAFLLETLNLAKSTTQLSANIQGVGLEVDNNAGGVKAVPLALNSGPGSPPLAVNSSVKVANLNADWLDGLSSTAFVRSTIEGWHYVGRRGEPAFQSGVRNLKPICCSDYQSTGFRIDNNHVVHITGAVELHSVGVGAVALFTLPPAYCPKFRKIFSQPIKQGSGTETLDSLIVFPGCDVYLIAKQSPVVGIAAVINGVSFPDASSDSLVATHPSFADGVPPPQSIPLRLGGIAASPASAP